MTYELNDPSAEYDLGLPGDLHVANDADQLYDDLAMVFVSLAVEAVEQRGVFHIALSGGTTPWPFYQRLVLDPRFRGVPWEQTHIWIVDERRVPDDDERNNFKSLRGSLLEDIPTPANQVHPMMVMHEGADALYEAEMRDAFSMLEGEPGDAEESRNPGVPCLDFVLLGMGADCHTASLFPNSDAIHVEDKLIVVNEGPSVTPPDRVTMTYPLLNAARLLAVLCVGAKKTEALKRVADQMKTGADKVNVPITGIQPIDGSLVWYLDREAAVGEG